MDKNHLKQVFGGEHKTIMFYLGSKVSADYLDADKGEYTITYINPIPVDVILVQTKPEKLKWKFSGVEVDVAQEFLMPKSFLGSLKLTRKIEIDGQNYYGFLGNNDRIQIQNLDDNYTHVSVARIK